MHTQSKGLGVTRHALGFLLASLLILPPFSRGDPADSAALARMVEVSSAYESFPDFKMDYKVIFHDEDGDVTTKRQFTRLGNRWRVNVWDAAGELRRIVSYDGTTFYDLLVPADKLSIATSLERLSASVAFEVTTVPLIFPYHAFFQSPGSRLDPRALFSKLEWAEKLRSFKFAEFGKDQSAGCSFTAQMNSQDIAVTYSDGAYMPSQVVLGNKSFGADRKRLIKILGTKMHRVSGVNISVPDQLMTADPVSGLSQQRDVTIDFIGISELNKGVSPDSFVIPKTAAKYFKDRDVHPYVK